MADLRRIPGVAGNHDPLDFSFEPPPGWRHRVTGRIEWQPPPSLVSFGRYLRRGRYHAGMTQQALADASLVSQSLVSRAERALAPSMGIDQLVRMGDNLGRSFPLGYCPHEHICHWQPIPRPPDPNVLVDPLADRPWLQEAARALEDRQRR